MTYGLIVHASPSDNQRWYSLDVRQSLSSWIASADSSGTGTLLPKADRPVAGSRLAFTTSSSGSNKIRIISGAFGLWIKPFKLAYTHTPHCLNDARKEVLLASVFRWTGLCCASSFSMMKSKVNVLVPVLSSSEECNHLQPRPILLQLKGYLNPEKYII